MKKLISMISLMAIVITAVTGITISSSGAEFQNVSGSYYYDYANQVLDLVNEQRTANGLSKLVMTESLTESAMIRAAETTVSFSHTRPNGDSCFTAFEYTSYAGENIAYGQSSAAQVMNAWMNSSGHRANILSSNFTTIGIGCFQYKGTLYWVQVFSGGSGNSYNAAGTKDVTVRVSLTSGAQSVLVSSGNESQTTTNAETTAAATTKPTETETVSDAASKPADKETTNTGEQTSAATVPSATAPETSSSVTTRPTATQEAAVTTTANNGSSTTSQTTKEDETAKEATTANVQTATVCTTKAPVCPNITVNGNSFTIDLSSIFSHSNYNGCQIKYSQNKDMSDCEILTINNRIDSQTIKNLCSGTYYIQIRNCNTSDNGSVNSYSNWSDIQCINTK